MRHNWVEVKDKVLRQYPVYRCTHCLTSFNYADLKLGTIHPGHHYYINKTWLSDFEIHKMTPGAAARSLGIMDDCEQQLVKNITES